MGRWRWSWRWRCGGWRWSGVGAALAAFVATGAASRFAMLAAMAALPPARADGLGRMAGRPDGVRLLAGAVLAGLASPRWGRGRWRWRRRWRSRRGPSALLALAAAGGQTGDVLGAVQVVSEVAAWLALVVVASG